MTIIKKRADELRVGDVLPPHRGWGRRVVCDVRAGAGSVVTYTHPTGSNPAHAPTLAPELYNNSDMVDVEALDLTPAQRHAEELFGLVCAWLLPGGVSSDWSDRARAVVDKIAPPEPPTLAEVLAALVRVTEPPVPGEAHEFSPHANALRVIERARRAGVL